ncbi:MAG: hypothetical protein MUF65_01990 [Rubritepida sp.]|jgi:hypothetical protein|nr:hypothetical protein [Rubritepida sp.]MCU0944121.1 hypothetical protein [Rubritepida sp.]
MPARFRNALSVLALTGLLGLGACTDPYGRYDPVATGLLGAGIGAAAGVAIAAAATPPRRTYVYAPPRYRGPPRGFYGPRYGYARPVYGHGYGGGWGHRPRYW